MPTASTKEITDTPETSSLPDLLLPPDSALSPPVRLCRHCGFRPARRSRPLCGNCVKSPKRRALHGDSQEPLQKNGLYVSPSDIPTVLPASPTRAIPGTEEKLRVMIERAEEGVILFHPGDACAPRRGIGLALQAEMEEERTRAGEEGERVPLSRGQKRKEARRRGREGGDGEEGSQEVGMMSWED